MNCLDFYLVFIKINLWKQIQFCKIVYIDVDVVVYRVVDEFFDFLYVFLVVFDIGWFDLFNIGVMVLIFNMGDYYVMMVMVECGILFDGVDQGFLNMYFGNIYNCFSFIYNVMLLVYY